MPEADAGAVEDSDDEDDDDGNDDGNDDVTETVPEWRTKNLSLTSPSLRIVAPWAKDSIIMSLNAAARQADGSPANTLWCASAVESSEVFVAEDTADGDRERCRKR